jgi:hypothetical protein
MYRLFVILVFICACSAPTDNSRPPNPAITITGALKNTAINEASGLARSQRDPEILWVINDDGKARVHAIDRTGASRGHINLASARNVDWEDLASFRLDGVPYLLIADTGDNRRRRTSATLYVVQEPDLTLDATHSETPAWQIDFTYSDGPRDVESVAIDIDNRRVLLLSKRVIPAVLYEIALVPEPGDKMVAMRLGPVIGLPQPSKKDIKKAPKTDNWYWQPTGMDISPDSRQAAIVTNDAVHYFERGDEGGWLDALQKSRTSIDIRKYRNAESVAFAPDSRSVYVTFEKKNAPILQIDAVLDEPEGR